MVGHTYEYNPAVEAVRIIIASGKLGEIYHITGSRVNLGRLQPDINVVWDLAPHDISILRFILGMDPISVSALGGVYVQRDKGIHDVAHLTAHFPDRILANVRVSWLDPVKIRRYTVVGSLKMLVYDDVEPDAKVIIYDKGVEVPPHPDTEDEFRMSYRTGETECYPVTWIEPLQVECQDFVDCIREGKEPRSSGRVGLKVVRILEAAHRSLLGRDVRIYAFVNLYGCEIGDESKIGTFAEIQKGVRIGRRVKISSHAFICEGVTIEDDVFIGHGVVFINDKYPRATTAEGVLQTEADWQVVPTVVRGRASIGSNATILCGVTIGEGAIVGAGSVVTRDVPPHTIVAGNTARVLRKITDREQPTGEDCRT
jgi:acetyltransferase-like isoleucine patch superfamily enzyme